MIFHKTTEQLPTCDLTPNSFGVAVLIKPSIDGDNRAFYGCRVSDEPRFYRYGKRLDGVRTWAFAPSMDPGTIWKENYKLGYVRRVRIVANCQDEAFMRHDDEFLGKHSLATKPVNRGKIGIVEINREGLPTRGARVTWAKPERFDGRANGYSPLTCADAT